MEDEHVALVILGVDGDRLRGMRIVPAAQQDIAGVAVELVVGASEGLAPEGVIRLALPRPGRNICSCLYTLPTSSLGQRVGELSAMKLAQLDDMLRIGELDWIDG